MYTQQNLKEILKSFDDKTAVEENGRSISYPELLHRSERVSTFLLNEFTPQSRIGICANEITDLVTSVLGVVLARCVFVPLDTSLPQQRLSHIISESNLDAVITSGIDMSKVNKERIRTFELTDLSEKDTNIKNDHVTEYQEEDDLYIFFTSGSTGVPKGIVGKNGSLWHFIKWEIKTFNIKPGCRFSQLISPFFDAFLRDIFVPLMSGGTICVPPGDEDFFSSQKLRQWIDDEKINLVHCVPSVFRIFNNDKISTDSFKELKYVLLSGERIIPSELTHWYEIFKDRIQLVNLYGTTEATMVSSYYYIRPEDISKEKIPIGKPIDDADLIVLDDNGRLCQPNSTGNLHIASQYLSKGYLNDPDLTEKRFITLNGATFLRRRAFCTGDRAKLLPDGSIDLLGREDRMIKVRGIRVDLDEIENLLVKYPEIERVAVVYNEKRSSIIAFITKSSDHRNDQNLAGKIMIYLDGYLPVYMLPSKINIEEKLPYLTNGKVNYRKLLEDDDPGEIVPPANQIEKDLVEIWSDILNIQKHMVDVTKSFFELGGHSINVIILVNRIFEKFNIKLSVREIFNYPSIRLQSDIIETMGEMKEEDSNLDFTEVSI
ncbi:Long-chain-fatty-acid--CoA ligase [Fulvivirga imtechensis AK7]|uniref:Long-chain-fatty-acid--CoA ligase n=1 Tax=Fulvivirga imtechensis AK7 TaxID=1237149 RepID=L8JGX1_9BACT|nr:non-ribosomal peptide synthetase [Fulvivirga imtechensis]ELR68116.1 Long-chain-fatty-acid--CoA ligase [Fulvivirga imtechensis AK7]